MTIEEASKEYQIPIHILEEYRDWGLCDAVKSVMNTWHYDETDIQRLSVIMTLHDIGFTKDEVAQYMRLYMEGSQTSVERLQMLLTRRSKAMDEIHCKEKQLERLDYLRYEIEKAAKSNLK